MDDSKFGLPNLKIGTQTWNSKFGLPNLKIEQIPSLGTTYSIKVKVKIYQLDYQLALRGFLICLRP